MSTEGRLAGRTALVTGGNGGIGLGIAEAFAAEGAAVAIAARNKTKLDNAVRQVSRSGGRVKALELDVSDRSGCFNAVEEVVDDFGSVDILVNGAAIYIPKRFLDYEQSDLNDVLSINLGGAFHLTQAVLPHMQSNGYGRIINVASTAGKWASKNQAVYNMAKHAMVGLTRCVALEHAADGVTVNAICPGLVSTDLTDQFEVEHAALNGTTPAVIHEELVKRIPMGRFLDTSECGSLAVYLASPEAAGMTGQSILLDGGMLFV